LPVTEEGAPLYVGTPWWRRVLAIVAGSTIAVVTGVVAATLIGFGASWVVITLSHMLKK
jgi:hypothetical protein